MVITGKNCLTVSGTFVHHKLHYAAHGHTAAEVIYERADADKLFMGLTSFNGELPVLIMHQNILYLTIKNKT